MARLEVLSVSSICPGQRLVQRFHALMLDLRVRRERFGFALPAAHVRAVPGRGLEGGRYVGPMALRSDQQQLGVRTAQ